MNKTAVIYTKAVICFLIPFFTGIVSGLGPYAVPGYDGPDPGKLCICLVIISSNVGGLTALSAFLSRSYADHQDGADAVKTNAANAAPPQPKTP